MFKTIFDYLLDATPGQEFRFYYPMIAFIVIMFAGSFLFKEIHKKKISNKDFVFKNLFKKVPARLIQFSIGFAFLTLIRYENIPYFAMRLWLMLLTLGFLFAIGYYTYKYLKVYPKELENFRARPHHAAEANKYLPNKRHQA